MGRSVGGTGLAPKADAVAALGTRSGSAYVLSTSDGLVGYRLARS